MGSCLYNLLIFCIEHIYVLPSFYSFIVYMFTAEAGAKYPFTRQLHTTRVVAGSWEPHGSSPTACAGKVDQP